MLCLMSSNLYQSFLLLQEMVQHPYDDFAGPPQKTREVDLKIIPVSTFLLNRFED